MGVPHRCSSRSTPKPHLPPQGQFQHPAAISARDNHCPSTGGTRSHRLEEGDLKTGHSEGVSQPKPLYNEHTRAQLLVPNHSCLLLRSFAGVHGAAPSPGDAESAPPAGSLPCPTEPQKNTPRETKVPAPEGKTVSGQRLAPTWGFKVTQLHPENLGHSVHVPTFCGRSDERDPGSETHSNSILHFACSRRSWNSDAQKTPCK